MLQIDLKGKVVFIAGVADDKGYGWAIARALYAAGATVIVGTWPPVLSIFKKGLEMGKFKESQQTSRGEMEIEKIYPLDAAFDSPEEVPVEILENKRYKGLSGYTIQEVAEQVRQDYGTIDMVVHSLANAPEASKPLLETSRGGYLSAVSASTYSFVSLVRHFGPLMKRGGSMLTLSYFAAEKVIPGYGGGLAGAKAALEGDTRNLAWEAGREYGIRINAISAGALGSRAAKAIGFIDKMISYSESNSPLQKELTADEVGASAAFLLSPLASAITGEVLHVDNGINAMGVAPSHPELQESELQPI